MKLSDEQRGTLQSVADAGPRGIPLGRFELQAIVDLIAAGLVHVQTDVASDGEQTIETARVVITPEGQRALAD
jgi:hypothetical protein